MDSTPQYAVMNLMNAEITKLSLNCFVTMKISFANELAALCSVTPGADDAMARLYPFGLGAFGASGRVGALAAGLLAYCARHRFSAVFVSGLGNQRATLT